MNKLAKLRASVGSLVSRSAVVLPLLLGAMAICPAESRADATFAVTYIDDAGEGFNDATLGTSRRTAFEAALNDWGTRITSTQVIRVSAAMDPLTISGGGAVLGSAGAASYSRDFTGAPIASTWYPAALADRWAGLDLDPSRFDIAARFNSSIDDPALWASPWYYGLDATPPGNSLDFYTVVMHEVGHGLGFLSFINSDGSYNGSFPNAFDRFKANGTDSSATLATDMDQSQRAALEVSDALYFNGVNARAANSGANPKLYAPTTYNSGSSGSHLNQTTFQSTVNRMMCPSYSTASHDPGPITIGIFKDMGWDTTLTPLGITISTPASGQTYGTLPSASGTATGNTLHRVLVSLASRDSGGNLTGWYDWNSGTFGTDPNPATIPTTTAAGTYGWSVNLPSLPTGNFRLQVQAQDEAATLTATAVSDFTKTAEVIPLSVSITSPSEDGVYTSLTRASGTAAGSTLARVVFALAKRDSADNITHWYNWQTGTFDIAGSTIPGVLATGTTSWSRTLPVLSDGLYLVLAQAQNSNGSQYSSMNIHTFSIASPNVTIGDATVEEGDPSGSTVNVAFTVTLSHVSSKAVSMAYATSPGTAGSTDYTTTNGTLIIPAGSLTGTINVPVVRDTTLEPDETFSLTLSSAINGILADSQATGTIQNDDYAPENISVSPATQSTNAGVATSLTAVYRDLDGAGDIRFPYILVNTVSNPGGGFYAYYSVASNKLWAWNGSAFIGGFAPKSANTIILPQGTLNCAGTTVTAEGNDLTVVWNFTPKTDNSFYGTKNVYLSAYDAGNASDAMEPLATWTINPSNWAPQNISVTPGSGSSVAGSARTLTAVYRDLDGESNITFPYILINSSATTNGGFYAYLSRSSNKLWVWNGTAFVGGFSPESSNTIHVPQGSLNCLATTVTGTGTDLTVNWNFTPKADSSFAGAKNIYLKVFDASNAQDGYDNVGSWTITPGNRAPENLSVTPASATSVAGTATTLSAVYRDLDGESNIVFPYILVNNSSTSVSGGLYAYLNRTSNKLWLWNGTAFVGGFAPGSSNTITVPQGSLNCQTTTTSGSGTDLTVNWSFTPRVDNSFTGAKNVYLKAFDSSNAVDGWDDLGDWTITLANRAPENLSITPASQSVSVGEPAVLSAVYRDLDGATDLRFPYLLVNTSASTAGAFYAYYNTASNKLWVWNGTTWSGGFGQGSSNSITVAQGTLNCSGTTVSGNGTDLTVNWSFTPSASFTGTKNVYLKVFDSANASDGWDNLGSLTIQETPTFTWQEPQVMPSSPSGNNF